MLKVGYRYGSNLVARVFQQQGYRAAAAAGSRFVIGEISKLPKFAWLVSQAKNGRREASSHPVMYSDSILSDLGSLGVELRTCNIDLDAFWAHVEAFDYPSHYAAGPMDEGGMREQKLLEYFVSMDLLELKPTDTIVDVASEWSIFPEMLRKQVGAMVYRQDLIYSPGIHADRIGGSAIDMPVPDGFAHKLVLHNAFEHFEGTADTDFMIEAWRVLRPGGRVCILPLFMSDRHSIVTDPLVERRGVMWDPGAQVVELPWWHNRFGRFYDSAALQRRVINPASDLGFTPLIYHFFNVKEVNPRAYLHFALVLEKPAG